MALATGILEEVKIRMRSVIMTAMIASVGLLPAPLFIGIGVTVMKPLAVVIIGGLITATILTLVFPIIFWIFNKTEKI